MKQVIIGNPIQVLVTIQKRNNAGVLINADPDNGVKITISSPDDTVLVNAASMTQRITGEYYYTYQTTSASLLGIYQGTILADSADYDGVYITEKLAELVANND